MVNGISQISVSVCASHWLTPLLCQLNMQLMAHASELVFPWISMSTHRNLLNVFAMNRFGVCLPVSYYTLSQFQIVWFRAQNAATNFNTICYPPKIILIGLGGHDMASALRVA